MKEQLAGKITHNPEKAEHGREMRTGELKKKEKEARDQQGAAALAHSDPSITSKEGTMKTRGTPVEGPNDPPFRVPPMTAIAGVLIRQWAEGTIHQANTVQKGNL